jgi:Ni,Fe-hydrogenase I cytochrome b subunit
LFVNIKTGFSIVLPFLKPNCSGIKTLFTHKFWFSILNVTLCNIFDNVVNNEIGLKFITLVLSPFLYMGLTFEYLNLSK